MSVKLDHTLEGDLQLKASRPVGRGRAWLLAFLVLAAGAAGYYGYLKWIHEPAMERLEQQQQQQPPPSGR